MIEFLNRESWARIEQQNSFSLTPKLLKSVVSDLIRSTEYDMDLDSRLIYLSHQKPSAILDYEVISPPKTDGQFDVCVNDGGRVVPIFTIGFGTTSIFYVNKFTQTDKMIYKAKLHGEFRSEEDLNKTIRDFIMSEPVETEVIDISREALEKKMNERKQAQPVSFENFKK